MTVLRCDGANHLGLWLGDTQLVRQRLGAFGITGEAAHLCLMMVMVMVVVVMVIVVMAMLLLLLLLQALCLSAFAFHRSLAPTGAALIPVCPNKQTIAVCTAVCTGLLATQPIALLSGGQKARAAIDETVILLTSPLHRC